MYREVIKGWFKHLDFMILDAVILEFSLLITYFSRHGFDTGITREKCHAYGDCTSYYCNILYEQL